MALAFGPGHCGIPLPMSAAPTRTWSPQQLADALRARGVKLSRVTLWRACAKGDIPTTRTGGGYLRIDPDYVERVWPGLGAADSDDASP